ncbi:MAG TPA: hypothetical protein P5149_13710 [Candidatus Competibacteraceae bacterium]|nr:hypothetical protein [Candidatus Competibacteraceae bacterium]MCP5132762.1 hypothetical protein [Gammaproteobacteria bacterium]HPF60000.1 hypothetical protein [Candidatus Competibacteraceae bacterium]HRY19443.1 hypothetical protein [Candidatus Competibacteraceae bacterium]
MSERSRLSWFLALLALAGLLAIGNVQAQSYRSYRGGDYGLPVRGRPDRPLSRQFADPDRAADAARQATGGRVLGVQGADERDGRRGYRVRILQPDGRVRNFHYDPGNGAMRDRDR